MTSEARSEAGFTLLEMLVVIALTAVFMSIVITLPLTSLHATEQPGDVAARFSVWLDQQQGNSIYATDPQRLCFQSHHIEIQNYYQGSWHTSQARFTLAETIETIPASSDWQQDGTAPCFLLAFNTLLPAGHVTFGPVPRVDITWGTDLTSGANP